MDNNKIKLSDINLSYKDNNILKDINLTLENNVYGLIGRNGAGKTTLLNVISRCYTTYKGSVSHSKDQKIFFVPASEHSTFPFSVSKFLKWNKYIAKSNIDLNDVIDTTNIKNILSRKMSSLSSGETKKVQIAACIISGSKVLLFDEPLANLDPIERINFLKIIEKIKNDKVIIISSHLLGDLKKSVNKLLLLQNGSLKDFGSKIPTEKELVKVLGGYNG